MVALILLIHVFRNSGFAFQFYQTFWGCNDGGVNRKLYPPYLLGLAIYSWNDFNRDIDREYVILKNGIIIF